jgi:rhamnose utilization protein RhaD (predicted bifunctional aldolase and dehydrogenase)
VISYAVLKNSKKILNEKLEGISWVWIPYVRPGLPLTKMLKKMNVADFDVIILANHGVVIGGDTKKEVLDIFEQVETRLCRSVRRNFLETDKIKLEMLVDSLDYKLPKHDLSHTLANDDLSLEIIGKNPLYPDHVIFLGPGTIPIITQEEFKYRSSEEPSNLYYKVVVIKGTGVIVNQNLSENAEEMLHCLANVLLRLHPSDKLQHLTQNQEAELLGWDAEKYRKSIQR